MLNNNFGELVKKYDKYTKKRRQKKLLSLLGLAAIIAAGFFFISKSEFIVNSIKKTKPEPHTQVDVKTPDNPKEIIKNKAKQPKEKPLQRVKVATPKGEELPNKVYKRSEKKIEKSNPFQLEVKERKNLYSLLTKDKEDNSYKSTVNVASFYFEEKDYDKAITWAVKASKKDPKQSLPWIIYAKSKAALGKTKVAEKALSIYLKHTNSKEVQNLLDNLK
jgi:predicted Zn-dependent protease